MNPLTSTERHHPPTVSLRSTNTAFSPRWYAALNPVGPAPITTVCGAAVCFSEPFRSSCLECNEDQREALAGELREHYGVEGIEVDLESVDASAPVLRGVDLLVSTTYHAGEVRLLARELARPYVLVTLDPTQRREIAALLAERPVYFIGVDPRWETKARAIWGDEPGAAAHLRHLTLGRDSLDDIPSEAAVLVMPSARRQLAGHPVLERALPARGFSRDSARQILSFVVQANIAAWLGQ